METISTRDFKLSYNDGDQDAAGLMRTACERSIALIRQCWGLDVPPDLVVYILDEHWVQAQFALAPWLWKVGLAVSFPFWYLWARRLWPYAGGWAQAFGRRRTLGVKPPRLIQTSNRSIGLRIFIQETSLDERVQHLACHELTHAFAAHLKLPSWLNEGLAMLTVDKYFGRPTVRGDTLASIASSPAIQPGRHAWLDPRDSRAVTAIYIRGYWVTRYLDAVKPGLLPELLRARTVHSELERRIAAAFEMERQAFWSQIDEMAGSYFAKSRGQA